MIKAYTHILLLELLAIWIMATEKPKVERFNKFRPLPKRTLKFNGMEFEDIYEFN